VQPADEIIAARIAALIPAAVDAQVRTATKPEFGHFQTSLPMRLGRERNTDPRQIATEILARLDVSDLCLPPAIAGRGFINFTLRPDYFREYLTAIRDDPRLGVPETAAPQRIVLDYSGPNIAKEMHAGHLRSTVIGDAIGRLLEFAGHDVIRQNHIGDWGTPFGMLIEQFFSEGCPDTDLAGLSELYRRSRAKFDTQPEFADRARNRVVALQQGETRTTEQWRKLVDISLDGFDATYRRLGIDLDRSDAVGESAYNDDLPVLTAELDRLGLLTESDGAQCVFETAGPPTIVRKGDGGYGYSATDLAAVRHRIRTLKADRLIYVVGAPQAFHFDQVFAVARRAGWLPDGVRAEHVTFGTVLDESGRPIKSRAGAAVTLESLLQTAESAAAQLLAERQSPGGPDLAHRIGVGAVKYADLSAGRAKDYVFATSRMVALDGNTGPYLQYAHARLTSLLGRAQPAGNTGNPADMAEPTDPAEIRLAFALTRFPAAVAATIESLEPHRLCGFLYQLATAFSAFYERCPVLAAESQTVRDLRICLSTATWRTLARGLELLGIPAPGTM
jgi:arginyl-tRNA synthetase